MRGRKIGVVVAFTFTLCSCTSIDENIYHALKNYNFDYLRREIQIGKVTSDRIIVYGDASQGEYGTLIEIASKKNDLKLIEFLLASFKDKHAVLVPMFDSIRYANLETVKLLYNYGYPLDDRGVRYPDITAICYAASLNRSEIIKLMLSLDVDPDLSTRGRTAILSAVVSGASDSINTLLDAGASLYVRQDDGWDTVSLAASYNRLDIVKLLVSKGISPQIEHPEYGTAANIAARAGNLDIVKYYVEELNYPINRVSGRGNMLYYATTNITPENKEHKEEVSKYLRENGAYVIDAFQGSGGM